MSVSDLTHRCSVCSLGLLPSTTAISCTFTFTVFLVFVFIVSLILLLMRLLLPASLPTFADTWRVRFRCNYWLAIAGIPGNSVLALRWFGAVKWWYSYGTPFFRTLIYIAFHPQFFQTSLNDFTYMHGIFTTIDAVMGGGAVSVLLRFCVAIFFHHLTFFLMRPKVGVCRFRFRGRKR